MRKYIVLPDVSLSKDEDITVEQVSKQIIDIQIELFYDVAMSPTVSIRDQLIKTEQIKNNNYSRSV